MQAIVSVSATEIGRVADGPPGIAASEPDQGDSRRHRLAAVAGDAAPEFFVVTGPEAEVVAGLLRERQGRVDQLDHLAAAPWLDIGGRRGNDLVERSLPGHGDGNASDDGDGPILTEPGFIDVNQAGDLPVSEPLQPAGGPH